MEGTQYPRQRAYLAMTTIATNLANEGHTSRSEWCEAAAAQIATLYLACGRARDAMAIIQDATDRGDTSRIRAVVDELSSTLEAALAKDESR